MKKIALLFLMAGGVTFLSSCESDEKNFDASGAFEAEETIIASEAMGKILSLNIEEGMELKAGSIIGYIDSTQLYLKKKQLQSQIHAVVGNKPNVSVQLAALQDQLSAAEKEKRRVENLLKDDVATEKQLDDVKAQIEVIKSQMRAMKSTLDISSESIDRNAAALYVQVEQIEDQLSKCKIVNPANGTILVKYAMENEMASPGKPLYKIADLSNIILRAYISGDQLSQVQLNQKVKVLTDKGEGEFTETAGTISWINSKAEFTPKTIQTKDERANLVYAIKVKVPNDGRYKIGMYGEIQFQ